MRREFPPTDVNLIVAIQSGDTAVFQALYRTYWRLLFRFACQATRDVDEAKDLIQDLFADIWQNRITIQADQFSSAYRCATLRHKLLDRIRQLSVRFDYRFEAEIWSGITQRTGSRNELLATTYPFNRQPTNDQPLHAIGTRFSYGTAALALLLLAGYVLWRMAVTNTLRPEAAYRTVSVPTGGRMAVTLVDGSWIRLDAKSTLRYPEWLTCPTWRVCLTGEGFFEETDPAHPFIVTTRTLTTTVKGTSFDVNAYADAPTAEVTVVTGKVAVVPSKGRHEAVRFSTYARYH